MAKSRNTINFRPYLTDLIVVIVGITIAFALENFSQSKKESNEEKLYLQALKEDLVSDKRNLRQLQDSSEVLMKNLGETFQFLYTNQPTDRFENYHITSAYTAPYFSGNIGTYNALINSGDLKIISSFGLKTALADHYNVVYPKVHDMDEFIRSLVDNHLYPYMLKNITFTGRKGIADTAPLKKNEAINLMGSYMNFLNNRNQIYLELSSKCDSLILKIENELK